MPRHRERLPQLGTQLFLTDGGLETTLVFHDGLDLPCFASFPLLEDDAGRKRLHGYFDPYLSIARELGAGFVLESATWRANADWGAALGYGPERLADVNRGAIELLVDLREQWETPQMPMIVSGCLGPRGDGYDPSLRMSTDAAADYHRTQIDTFATTLADVVTAMTMTHAEEAAGIALAARDAGIPAAISFTVETDGRLPTGQSLGEAIEQVDAETGAAPAYYMVNCAHPSHFAPALEADATWIARIRGLRANASKRSHAELDAATELDEGDPAELGAEHRELCTRLPHLTILGGCCGTDDRHVGAIARACAGVVGPGER